MYEKYKQFYFLLEELEQWNPRLDKIQTLIHQPDFRYDKENGADFIIALFLRTCYWLDKELFDESYLYQKEISDLLPIQKVHFKMVDIGAFLKHKGFPIEYRPSQYSASGPNQLGPYIKVFVGQCQKRYGLFYNKTAHKNHPQIRKDLAKIKD